jgi:hypothetical protein
MSFYLVSFGAFAHFLWQASHPTAVLVIGFSVLAYATKIVGEVYLIKEREKKFAVLQAEYEKKLAETPVFTGKGSN